MLASPTTAPFQVEVMDISPSGLIEHHLAGPSPSERELQLGAWRAGAFQVSDHLFFRYHTVFSACIILMAVLVLLPEQDNP